MAARMNPHDEVAARLAAIVESSEDAIIGTTSDGVITSWNRAAEKMFGYTAAEAIGRHIALIIPEDLRKEEDDVLARVRRGKGVQRFETVRVAKNGQRLTVSLTVSPIRDAAGQVVGASKIARDITDRKRAAEALAHSETQAGAILEAVSEGIVIVDQRGTIVSVNRRTEAMFGYPREALLGQPLEMLLPERLRSRHSGHRASYFQDPRGRPMGQGLDLLARRSDGTEFPVEISLSYVETEKGLRGLAFVTDITQRPSMERATRQAERLAALGRLSAGIAHELNNPIGIISSRIEIMLLDAESQPLPTEVTEDLRVLHRNAQRVARIAQGLLSFARQSSGERAPVDLNHLVEETLLLTEKQLIESGITIERALAPDLPPVLGDSNALQQVVLNLLTNARDALEKGGKIAVGTSVVAGRPGGARLTVRDTGSGIPPEHLPRIFDPFFTTKSEGTGLGLSISYGIVRDHQGTVDVQSRPGQGTTFTLTFPIIAEDGHS
ncbi:MAG TPA: PAS domain S-box protein [Methylomirabilota bacterium]|nr:PAS domain S-box protein [Methylomirabilota bacterium]